MSMEPDDPFTPDVMEKLDQAAREHGVTIVVVGETSVTTIIPFLPPETGVPIEESRLVAGPVINSAYANPADLPSPTPATGEKSGRRILLVDSGMSGGGFGGSRLGRSMLHMAAGLALAAASAQALPATPSKKASSLFPRIPKNKPPGMDKSDLQRLQRQHAQKANLKSRYKPR